ncbi:MAG: hypothetical protein ACKVQR_22715 [Aquabacterium sp.]
MLKLKDLLAGDHHKRWSALKKKHAKAIAAKKVDFDSKLGPTLDKYAAAMKVVNPLFARHAVTTPVLEKLVAVSRPLRQVAEAYQDKSKGLGDPAEKEIVAFLKALESDCRDWEKVLDLYASGAIAGRNTTPQMKAVRELYGNLDALGQQLINLRRCLPDAVARLPKIANEADYKAYQMLAGQKGQKPDAEKDWRKDLAADMGIVKAQFNALIPLTDTSDTLVKRLVALAHDFKDQSDYGALRDLARSLAANGAMVNFKQRAQTAESFMNKLVGQRVDFKGTAIAGADAAQLRRSMLIVKEVATHLIDPALASVRALP